MQYKDEVIHDLPVNFHFYFHYNIIIIFENLHCRNRNAIQK
jgi:hypothetical protein